MKKLVGITVCLLALSGCGTSSSGEVPLPSVEPQAVPTTPVVVVEDPQHISIPAIDAKSDFIPTGLNPDGTIEVPPIEKPEQVSWYEGFSEPGEVGRPAVILGHVDGSGKRGVFYNLKNMSIGDEVIIDDMVFQVYKKEIYPKNEFPTDAVYAPSDTPEVRLITCGGTFGGDRAGHYDDNVVIFAHLASRQTD